MLLLYISDLIDNMMFLIEKKIICTITSRHYVVENQISIKGINYEIFGFNKILPPSVPLNHSFFPAFLFTYHYYYYVTLDIIDCH